MDNITVTLTEPQVRVWLDHWEHLADGEDADLKELYRLLRDAPRPSRNVPLVLTAAQACDLYSYYDYALDVMDPSDPQERNYARGLANAMARLRDAGVLTIEEFNLAQADPKNLS